MSVIYNIRFRETDLCRRYRENDSSYCRLVPSDGVWWNCNVQPSDVTYHLVGSVELQRGSVTGLAFLKYT